MQSIFNSYADVMPSRSVLMLYHHLSRYSSPDAFDMYRPDYFRQPSAYAMTLPLHYHVA